MSACKSRGKSLIEIRNKSGPKTDPCGTPALTFFRLDKQPFAVKECRTLRSGPFIPLHLGL